MVRAMLRPTLVFVLVAGVTAAHADDRRDDTKSTQDNDKAKVKPKTKAKPAPKKKPPKEKQARLSRAVTKHTRMDNMPAGWTWPPSQAMDALEKSCEAKLDAAGVSWKSASREGRIPDAITVADTKLGGIAYSGVYTKGPFKMDCQLALALENVGTDLYALGVREIRFGSVYRWSNVRVGGKTHDVLSRHALGLAMDVVSFVDESGREAVVGRDYKQGDELLLDIEKTINESGKFRLVLTPKNDPLSHKDHFHLEANPDYSAPP
jgi:hypothetical protein